MSLFSFFVQKNKGNILRKNKTYTQDETIILTLDISKLPVGTYILKIMDPYNRTIYQQKISRESNRIVGKYILSIPLSESYPDGIYSVYVINIASGSTFKETFEMSLNDPILAELKLGQRVGERSKLQKVRNLIIGWLAEEIAHQALKDNVYVKEIEPSGVDIQRTVELYRTPTDPDYRVQLKNGKILFVEVVSIGKVGDGIIRLKYNKVKRNLMKYFGLSKGKSVHWQEHFLNPCVYLCLDLISADAGNFILEGADFYTRQVPVRYAGWENQEVVVFDQQKRCSLPELLELNLEEIRENIVSELKREFSRLHEAATIIGNPLLMPGDKRRRLLKFFRELFELDHKLSIKRRRDAAEAVEIRLMREGVIKTFKELPKEYQEKLFAIVKDDLSSQIANIFSLQKFSEGNSHFTLNWRAIISHYWMF